MNRAIITGWTGTLFAKMGCYTLPLIEEYAAKHGAFFACGNLNGERPPSWNKVILLLQALEQVDEVAWIDCDVVIERGDKSIFDELKEDSWQGMVEHQTECGTVPNCGIWVLRKQMIPILEEIWNSGENINHPWWEQASIITKMGYEVNHTNAVLGTPSDLYSKTTFLNSAWNHHPSDIRKVEEPYFRHITMYEDRLAETKKYALIAEKIKNNELNATNKVGTETVEVKENYVIQPVSKKSNESKLNILVQCRKNLNQAKGGDTIALLRSCEALINLGVNVKIDVEGRENPKDYDLLHLYNFATPEALEPRARRAKELDVPFVVTTLHEDLDNFFPKMRIYGEVYEKILQGEYSDIPHQTMQEAILNAIKDHPNNIIRDNSFVARNAEALLSSGSSESSLLREHYPFVNRIEEVKFGSDSLPNVGKDLFFNKYKVKDYILCVGRIEWRKNQAMLLKAMEDSEIPIVLIAGNMSYQPSYENAVSKFKRKGKTIVLSNLSIEELGSAYQGALLHVLPSWYELPGLVSLEAAKCGVPIIGTNYGTLSDYMGREAIYCNPESLDSIRSCIEMQINKPNNSDKLKERASKYTWENTARSLIEVYKSVLDSFVPRKFEQIQKSEIKQKDIKEKTEHLIQFSQ